MRDGFGAMSPAGGRDRGRDPEQKIISRLISID